VRENSKTLSLRKLGRFVNPDVAKIRGLGRQGTLAKNKNSAFGHLFDATLD
jgi:hypothetical protein